MSWLHCLGVTAVGSSNMIQATLCNSFRAALRALRDYTHNVSWLSTFSISHYFSSSYRYVYLQLFNALEWKKVAALTEDGQKYTEYISNLQDLLQNHGINFVANRKFPPDREPDAMSQVSISSVIIIIFDI